MKWNIIVKIKVGLWYSDFAKCLQKENRNDRISFARTFILEQIATLFSPRSENIIQ